MIEQVNYKGLYKELIKLSSAEKKAQNKDISEELAGAAKNVKKLGRKKFLGRVWAFFTGKSPWKRINARRNAKIAVALQPLESTLDPLAQKARMQRLNPKKDRGVKYAELVRFVASNTGLIKPDFLKQLANKKLEGLLEQRARIEGILEKVIKGKTEITKKEKKLAKAEAKLPKQAKKLMEKDMHIDVQGKEFKLQRAKRKLGEITAEKTSIQGFTEEKAYQALAWLNKAISDVKATGKFEVPVSRLKKEQLEESPQLGVPFNPDIDFLGTSFEEYERQMPDEEVFFAEVGQTFSKDLANTYSLDELEALKEQGDFMKKT